MHQSEIGPICLQIARVDGHLAAARHAAVQQRISVASAHQVELLLKHARLAARQELVEHVKVALVARLLDETRLFEQIVEDTAATWLALYG